MSEEVPAEAEDAPVIEVEEVVETVEADAKTEETEEATEDEDKVKEPSESSTEKKQADGVQKRIDELTKIRRTTERDRDYWKELAQSQQPTEEPAVPGKTLADFEYDEAKFSEYLVTHARESAKADVDKTLAQERYARARSDFSSKESEFSSNLDDYHIVTRNNDLKISAPMLEVMQGSDEGPAVLYYLGKNPDVAERLAGMQVLDMARELGHIEATKLSHEKAPSIPKAPAPAPKIAATTPKVSIEPSKMSDAQFRKWRLKAIANR